MTPKLLTHFVFAALSFILVQAALASNDHRTFDEYGRPTEMRGLIRLYLDVGDDIDLREHVIRTIETGVAPTKIEWATKAQDAELCLSYVAWQERKGDDTFAKLFAFTVTAEGKSRLLWSANDR